MVWPVGHDIVYISYGLYVELLFTLGSDSKLRDCEYIYIYIYIYITVLG